MIRRLFLRQYTKTHFGVLGLELHIRTGPLLYNAEQGTVSVKDVWWKDSITDRLIFIMAITNLERPFYIEAGPCSLCCGSRTYSSLLVWYINCIYQTYQWSLDFLPWASCQIRKIVGCAWAGNAGNDFPATDFKGNRQLAIPACNHGTCITHVPWCMSGLLTRGGGGNVPNIPGACATRNFMYLARGPWDHGTCWYVTATLSSMHLADKNSGLVCTYMHVAG